ncbi:hypothetical protein MTsPCn3_04980 [Erythrobacter sp. MTPC3]
MVKAESEFTARIAINYLRNSHFNRQLRSTARLYSFQFVMAAVYAVYSIV